MRYLSVLRFWIYKEELVKQELLQILKFNIPDHIKVWLIIERVKEVFYGLKHGIDPDEPIPYEV